MRNLDPVKLEKEGFPRTLINLLCDVDTHIIPELYKHKVINYRPGKPPLDLSIMVRRGSVGSASACWKAGPSSIPGSAPQGGLSH